MVEWLVAYVRNGGSEASYSCGTSQDLGVGLGLGVLRGAQKPRYASAWAVWDGSLPLLGILAGLGYRPF
jgi:hypothetical protein